MRRYLRHAPDSLALSFVLLGSFAASAAQVWTASAAQKVRPLAVAPSAAPVSASIAAAKNEFEGFQVVVTGAAGGVSMSFAGLSDGQGHTIGGADVVLYREDLINITTQSGGDGATGWWPDALVPNVDPIVGEKRNAFPFDVPAGESRVVYVDVHVPADAAAGTYTGTVMVSGGVTAQVPVTLTVWDFAIPSTTTLQVAFGIAWNGPCLGHGDGSCSNMAYEKDLRARYVQSALDNRVSVSIPDISVPVSASGASNWTGFDNYGGRFLDGTVSSMRLQGAKLTAVQIFGSNATPAVASWSTHFKAKGWYPALFNYICDEPPLTCAWTDIPLRIGWSRTADPLLTTLVTTQPYTAAANGVTSGIDRFVAVINFLEGKPGTSLAGNQRANWPANIWLYQGCMSHGCGGGTETGWPTYAIDADATRNRAMEWMTYIFDGTGELYYEMTQAYFGGDPWVTQWAFGGNGDGTFFYPGTPAKIGGVTEIPVESLRLKQVRDGMEDYELLHLATTLGFGAQAKQIALGVYPHAYQGFTSPAALDEARAELAGLILDALGKGPTHGGTPDAGSDAGTPVDGGTAVDAGIDAGVPLPDAGADAGTPIPDAGTPVPDAGTDAGTPVPDAGTDAGTPVPDAGTDAGTPPDAGSDAGTPPPDPGSDAGTPATDAGSTPPDAGTPPTDAGTIPDAGVTPPPDAGGDPQPDAGTDAGSDAGTLPLGRARRPPPQIGTSSVGYTGCSTTGVQSLWLAVAAAAPFLLRGRRRPAH